MDKLLTIGAVLWDVFPDEMHIGGAPFNVAAHAARRGMKAYILTRIGKDELGEKSQTKFQQLNVHSDFVQLDEDKPTGIAKVTFSSPGIPEYDIPEDVAYNNIQCTELLLSQLEEHNFDFIYFGSMEQKSLVNRFTISEVLAKAKKKYVFFDVNIRFGFYPLEVMEKSFRAADIVKINDEEALLLSKLFYGESMDFEAFALKASSDFHIRIFIITLGAKGCIIYDQKESRFEMVPGFKVKVADTVGSGDGFCAAFMETFARTNNPFEAAREGNRLGAYIASKSGAIPKIEWEELEMIGKTELNK
ncbi:MAG: PfkB protein [Lachnospiraceae bacterium]|jgi:fructokinase|nr:PfkB protein [Lachnospiraceae bacterium]